MIKGSELLTSCALPILQLANGLEAKYGTIVITSGYRSPEYNKSVGGAKDSMHCSGKAIDVHVPNVSPIKVAAWVLDNYSFVNGVGLDVYKGYTHLDCRDGIKAYWSYNKQGVVA